MPIHVLFGEDAYSIHQAVGRIRAQGAFEDVDVIRLDARSCGAQDVLMAAGTGGLFSSRRLVIIEKLEETLREGNRRSGKARKAEQALSLSALMEATADSTTVLMLCPGAKSDLALIRDARAAAKTCDQIEVREFRAPRRREMAGWLVQQGRDLGVRLDARAAQRLALRVGEEPSVAGMELLKLAVAAGPGEPVTVQLVEAVVPVSAEESIFPVVDAIATSRRDLTLKLVERQLAQSAGDEVELLLRLIRLVARQFRILLQIRLLLESEHRRAEIISTLGLPDYLADRYFSQARGMSQARLAQGLQRLAAAEQGVKSGEAGEAILHLLLMELTDNSAQAERQSR